jgi:WD40 repeat protein
MPTAATDNDALDVKAVRKFAAGEAVFSVEFVGECAFCVLGEELLLARPNEPERRLVVHAGAILAAASDGHRLITGGDDGKLVATDREGQTQTLAVDAKRRWIQEVAARSDGAFAWSAGRDVFLRDADGREHRLVLPAAAGGLALAPDDLRVVVAHNNGVTIWIPEGSIPAETWQVKGSHTRPSLSPDGHFLATAMHDPTVTLWRLCDMANMPLTGSAQRVRSMAWAASSSHLACAGSERLLLWPAPPLEGSMYSVPFLVAPYRAPVARVACHPSAAIAAVGFEDGLVLLVRLRDGAEIVLSRPAGSEVSALAWRDNGASLACASADGAVRLIEFG